MAGKGKDAVIEKYNWDNDSKALLNLYRNLVPKKRIL
jgi:hypothetical protein